MTMFWKKVYFDLLTPPTWQCMCVYGGGGVCAQNFCYHVAACVILFYLICDMTIFWKSWILTFCLHPRVRGESAGKIIAPVLMNSWFRLIWYAKWPWSETVGFWPFDPTPSFRGGGGSAGKIFATMLLHASFPLIWYETWPYSNKSWILTFWPHPQGRGGGGGVCGQNICYNVAACGNPFNLVCNMTIFGKI